MTTTTAVHPVDERLPTPRLAATLIATRMMFDDGVSMPSRT